MIDTSRVEASQISHDRLWRALPDRSMPVKTRAAGARLSRLAVLTGIPQPAFDAKRSGLAVSDGAPVATHGEIAAAA